MSAWSLAALPQQLLLSAGSRETAASWPQQASPSARDVLPCRLNHTWRSRSKALTLYGLHLTQFMGLTMTGEKASSWSWGREVSLREAYLSVLACLWLTNVLKDMPCAGFPHIMGSL